MPPIVRIVPKVSARGWAAGAFAGGAASTAAFILWVSPWLDRLTAGAPRGMVTEVAMAVLAVFVPPMVLSVLVVRQTPRWRTALLTPAAWMMGLSLGGFTGSVWQDPSGVFALSTWQGASYLIPLGIFAGLGVGIGALVRWIGGCVRRPVVQTGTLCWRCSFDPGAAGMAVCPECASPMDAGRFRRRWLFASMRVMNRAGRPLAVLALVGIAVVSATALLTDGLPIMRFYRALGNPRSMVARWVYVSPKMDAGYEWNGSLVMQPVVKTQMTEADAAWSPRDLHIAYAYWLRAPSGGPAHVRMRVFLATYCTAAGWEQMADEGTVRICCELDQAQAERVIAAGHAPDSLIQALLEAGKREGWGPQALGYGPNYSAKQVEIDPQEHFGPGGAAPTAP